MHQTSVKWMSDEHQMPSDNTDSTYLIMESIHYWSHFIGFILWGVNFLESLHSRVRILGFFKQFKPQTLCMVVLDANHYTRTNDTNDDEIITINNKKIWSKFLKLFLWNFYYIKFFNSTTEIFQMCQRMITGGEQPII